MPREPRVYLWDARAAAAAILDFTRGRTAEAYAADPMLSAAVERKFTMLGEALGQLAKAAPEIAGQIPDLPRIVAFRSLLVHGYAVVEPARIWGNYREGVAGAEKKNWDCLGLIF